jgi:hypothetical protein
LWLEIDRTPATTKRNSLIFGWKALDKALKGESILPAVGIALLAPSLLSEGQSDDQQRGMI